MLSSFAARLNAPSRITGRLRQSLSQLRRLQPAMSRHQSGSPLSRTKIGALNPGGMASMLRAIARMLGVLESAFEDCLDPEGMDPMGK